MLSQKYSLDLNVLKGLSESDRTQVLSAWTEWCSSLSISDAIDREILEQINFYEAQYQLSSSDLKLRAEQQEFIDNPEVSFWLTLIESYPECLTIENLKE